MGNQNSRKMGFPLQEKAFLTIPLGIQPSISLPSQIPFSEGFLAGVTFVG